MRVGVLALQGGFARHVAALERVGVDVCEVRRVRELDAIEGLVLPGGESTTLLNLMRDEPWFESLRQFVADDRGVFATCAGTILLAESVSSPEQESLGLLDIDVERNGWGRQVDSFEADLAIRGFDRDLRAAFIRAPRIRRVGRDVRILAEYRGEPVLVRRGPILAATFHPELTGDDRLHASFVDRVRGRTPDVGTVEAAPVRIATETSAC